MQDHAGLRMGGLLAGPIFFLLIALLAPGGDAMWLLGAVMAWMLIWWVSEAAPLAVTSLLPIVLLPVLNVMPVGEVTINYTRPIIFLMLAGFTIALAMQKSNLHKRIVVAILRITGTHVNRVILGFILASGLLSMWISNTATTAAMLPIALSFIAILSSSREEMRAADHRLALTILLGIAFAANIGGTATLIGTVPNALLASFMDSRFGINLDFLTWMLMAMPFSIIMLFVMWFMLTRLIYPNASRELAGFEKILDDAEAGLGKISHEEKSVMVLFGVTVFFWIFHKFIPVAGLNYTVIGIAAAIACFAIPVRVRVRSGARADSPHLTFLLSWEDMKEMPWGVLLLLGGGLALGAAMTTTGLSAALGDAVASYFALGDKIWIPFAALALILTEFASNTAIEATLLPVISEIAVKTNSDPLMFGIPMTLATSCAFMMPVATPPNALVFASGHIRVTEMIYAGFWINLAAIVLIILITQITVPFFSFLI